MFADEFTSVQPVIRAGSAAQLFGAASQLLPADTKLLRYVPCYIIQGVK